MTTHAITLTGITKAFGAHVVLNGVDVELSPGEVTALLGANGAGKSTLIRVMCGVYTDYGGRIDVADQPATIDSPIAARHLGIEVVHQKMAEAVVPGLSVAENLVFDQIVDGTVSRMASRRSVVKRAREVASVLDLDWSESDLRRDVFELSIADQQLTLLARALVRDPKILILDEPTSALSDTEAQALFGVIDDLRDQGVAVLYVSHRLAEIDQIADRLLVLRDGQISRTEQQPFDWPATLDAMLGSATVSSYESSAEMRGAETTLALQHVQLLDKSKPFDLEVRAGEVLGVFGLLGSGMEELAHGIFGAEPFRQGAMTLDGERYAPKSPADAIGSEVYLVPEDRASGMMVADWSIAHTTSLPFLSALSPSGVIDRAAESRLGAEIIERFGVVSRGANEPVTALSGGNQQKVCVGRWLNGSPKVMVLHEPYQGVDVGARHDLSDRTRDTAADGTAVIVLSSDIEELYEVADRVVVLVDGNLTYDAYLADTDRTTVLAHLTA